MTPGRRPERYDGDLEPEALADWMTALIDGSPDRLALIELPATAEADLDDLEAVFSGAFDTAKATRPDLSVKVLTVPAEGLPGARIVLALHEHRWVGGHCVNGCDGRREMDGLPPAA